jgi:hypothetical protein
MDRHSSAAQHVHNLPCSEARLAPGEGKCILRPATSLIAEACHNLVASKAFPHDYGTAVAVDHVILVAQIGRIPRDSESTNPGKDRDMGI